MPLTISQIAKDGLLLNPSTGLPFKHRAQVYRLMRKMGKDSLTEEDIEVYNEAVQNLLSTFKK